MRKLARVISLTVCAGGGNIVGELNQKGVFKKVPLHVSKVYSSDDVLFSTDKLDNSDKFNILRARLNNNSVMEIEFASGNTFLAAKVRPKSKLCRRLLRSPN